MSDREAETIYVRLLDEGTKVFRPVKAHRLENGVYEIDADQPYDDEDERWEFPPGATVIAENRSLQSGTAMIAIQLRQA